MRTIDDIDARIVFAVLLGLSLCPVLLTPIPAMVDYPNHLARMYLIARDGTPDANPFYQIVWALYPNLAMDLIIPQIARAIGVEQAARLFLLVSQVLIVSGAMAIERVVKGRVQIAGFVALMFLYCLPFAWGFLNFEFALGVALWGVAAMLRVQERGWLTRFGVNLFFVVALFAAHFFALGIYGATLGFYELWRAWSRKAVAQAALRLALLAVPVVAMLAIMQLAGGGVGGEGTSWFFAYKPLWLFRIMSGYSLTVSSACVVLLLGFIYVAAKQGLLKFAPGGLWLAIGFGILYCAMPSRLFDTSFVDFRILAAAALILPAFCTPTLPTARWKLAALACAGVITLANLAVVGFVWRSYRADYAAMIRSFGKIERGSSVLTGDSGPGDDPPFHDLTEYPIYYAPTLAAHYANAFVPGLFTAAGKQPVRVGPIAERLAIPYGGPVPVAILAGIAAGKTGAGVPAYIKSWPQDYDYLYVLGPRIPNPMPDLLEELDRAVRFTLYRIRRKSS
ncbi:MAG TPA: hypothetical protein VGC38_00010 [Pseudolabrys sp.]